MSSNRSNYFIILPSLPARRSFSEVWFLVHLFICSIIFDPMTRKDRFKAVIDYFKITRPEAETELVFGNTYELLVAVILSAQCTDKRVNMTTPALFARYPDVVELSKANYEDLFAIIKSIS